MLIDPALTKCLSEGLNAVARASLQGGAVLFLVWGISRLWVRAPAAARLWMWRVAYLKLIISLCWMGTIMLPLWATSKCTVYVPGASLSATAHETPRQSQSTAQPPVPKSAVTTPSADSAPPNAGAIPRHPWRVQLGRYVWMLFPVWVLGVVLGVIRLLFARFYARRLKGICHPVEQGEIHNLLAELSLRMGVRRPPTVLVGDGVNPMLMGISHPTIVLPAEQLAEGNTENLRLVLAHELAHLRRRDLLWNWLPMLAETLFFFHPLVWIATREAQLAQEIACDDLTLRSTESASGDYAKMLVDVAARSVRSPRNAMAAVGISESFITLKRRIHAMRWHRGVTRMEFLIAGMVVVLLGVALTTLRVLPRPPQKGLSGGYLRTLIISPDGRHLAIQYEDNLASVPGKSYSGDSIRFNESVEIRNLATGELEREVQYQNIRGIADMAFSRDNRALLISLRENTWGPRPFSHPIRVCYRLDLDNGKLEKAMSDVGRFWVNQNGNTLWTDVAGVCINDGYAAHAYLVQRDLRTGKELRRLPPLSGVVTSISPDGTKAVTSRYGYILNYDRTVLGYRDVSLVVWDLAAGKQLVTLEGKRRFPSFALAFSPDGSMFAASEQDESHSYPRKSPPVRIWNVATGKVICTLTGNTSNVRGVVFSPDNKKLAAVDDDGHVILWDIARKADGWVWQAEDVRGIAFSLDGKTLVTGSNINTGTPAHPYWIPGPATILDVKTGQPVRTIKPLNPDQRAGRKMSG